MFALLMPPILIVYLVVTILYVKSALQLIRLSANTRSPIYAHFEDTIQVYSTIIMLSNNFDTTQGIETMHAFGKQSEFMAKSTQQINQNMDCMYQYIIADKYVLVYQKVTPTLQMDSNADSSAWHAYIIGIMSYGDDCFKCRCNQRHHAWHFCHVCSQCVFWFS